MGIEGWVVLGLSVPIGAAMLAGAMALSRRESRTRRVRLPARLISTVYGIAGYVLTVEFPGPDGAPRQTVVFSATRRGLGATPHFSGWVWVDRDDPSDVIVRPHARAFWPVFLSVAGGVVLGGGLIAAAVIAAIGALNGLGS